MAPLDIGPQPRGDAPSVKIYRRHQSWYRAAILQVQCGPWRKGGRTVGSSLVDGHTTGKNFISDAAFAYAKERVAAKAQMPELTIDEFRLYNNMLSSMPMCFNLFADLRTLIASDPAQVVQVLKAMFVDAELAKVDNVVVEMIPTPISAYTDDKTAFDAAIHGHDADGGSLFIGIETKYTDELGKNRAAKQGRKLALAKELGLFTPTVYAQFERNGFDQIARNLLLAFAYQHKHGIQRMRSIVLAPKSDNETCERVRALQQQLAPRFRSMITCISLEDSVARAQSMAKPALRHIFDAFHHRYLDLQASSQVKSQ